MESVQPQVLSIVSEPKYEFGVEAFEAYVKESNAESMTEKVQKNSQVNKAR